MKKSRFTESQIVSILRQARAGTHIIDICREHGISSATFYNWRAKYGDADVSVVSKLKELEQENARLKKMYADTQLKYEIAQEALAGKY